MKNEKLTNKIYKLTDVNIFSTIDGELVAFFIYNKNNTKIKLIYSDVEFDLERADSIYEATLNVFEKEFLNDLKILRKQANMPEPTLTYCNGRKSTIISMEGMMKKVCLYIRPVNVISMTNVKKIIDQGLISTKQITNYSNIIKKIIKKNYVEMLEEDNNKKIIEDEKNF